MTLILPHKENIPLARSPLPPQMDPSPAHPGNPRPASGKNLAGSRAPPNILDRIFVAPIRILDPDPSLDPDRLGPKCPRAETPMAWTATLDDPAGVFRAGQGPSLGLQGWLGIAAKFFVLGSWPGIIPPGGENTQLLAHFGLT